jgi:hypothetical protein
MIDKSLSGDSLVIALDKDNKATVNEIPITQSDIIAANGVIHEIDETFKPDIIQFDTRKYMYGCNATHVVDLLDKYQLSERYLDQKDYDYTFLVPPLDRINSSLISSSWLTYHIMNESWPQDKLIDNTLLKTEFRSPELGGMRQRLPVYVERENIVTAGGQSIHFDRARVTGDNSEYITVCKSVHY